VPVKPYNGVSVSVLVPDVPCMMFRLAGETANVKLGAAATVRATVAFADMLPEVPVTVKLAVPTLAEALAASVSVLVEPMLVGLNVAVTPAGNPAIVRLAAPVKPYKGVSVTVLVPDVPCVTLKLAGAAASLKLGAAVTVKPRVAVAEMLPDFAVMVKVAAVTDAEALAVSVSVLVEVALAGLKAAVTPEGKPPIVRFTAPVKPFTGVTVMVLDPWVPCMTLRLAGAAANETPGGLFTVRPIVTEADDVPAVPVTLTVAVPVVAADAAVSVTVLVVAVLEGLNEAVTPAGRPDALSVTLPLKPLLGVTVMVSVTLAPCITLSVEAEAANEKPAGAATVRVMPTVALRLPD